MLIASIPGLNVFDLGNDPRLANVCATKCQMAHAGGKPCPYSSLNSRNGRGPVPDSCATRLVTRGQASRSSGPKSASARRILKSTFSSSTLCSTRWHRAVSPRVYSMMSFVDIVRLFDVLHPHFAVFRAQYATDDHVPASVVRCTIHCASTELRLTRLTAVLLCRRPYRTSKPRGKLPPDPGVLLDHPCCHRHLPRGLVE